MEFIYAAEFEKNADETYTVSFPDISGCITEGKTLYEALYMAESALRQRIEYLLEKNTELPKATSLMDIDIPQNGFVNYVCTSVKDTGAVRRTVSIPKWLDERASASGLSLSKVLQDALRERVN